MRGKQMKKIAVLIILLMGAGSSTSHAGGTVHGGKAAGMGTAFIGVADDPSAIMHNAAGLALLKGTHIYGGVSLLYPETEYQSPEGATEGTEFDMYFPPHLYAASGSAVKDIVIGLGIHPTFGVGGRTWPEDGLTRFRSVESYTGTMTINPAVAWEVRPGLAVAFGMDYMYALNRAKTMLDQSLFGAGDAEMLMEADGGGWGWNAGTLITVHESVRIGLAYRSRVKVDFSGDLEINDIAPALQPLFGSPGFETDVSTTTTFPDVYSFGIAYFPAGNIVIAFDVEMVAWSTFRQTDLDLDDEVPAAGVADSRTPLDWNDSWQFKAGIDYRVNETLSLRGGYAFINTPVPEHTLSPAAPDADQHNFSIGTGYRTGKWTLDAYYNFGLYEDRNVNNTVLSGEYESRTHYAGLSIGYRM